MTGPDTTRPAPSDKGNRPCKTGHQITDLTVPRYHRIGDVVERYPHAHQLEIYDGRDCAGVIIDVGRRRVFAFDTTKVSLGIFPSRIEASRTVRRAFGESSRTLAS